MKTAEYWITKLNLIKHPEGGWYREIYRSDEIIPKQALSNSFSGDRNLSTSIYYLLEGKDFSSFHRIKSDEIWHYYVGNSAVEIHTIQNGKVIKRLCGNQPEVNHNLQIVVPGNTWFAARLVKNKGFALVGCTVSPGFNFEDFEMANRELVRQNPEIEQEIVGLIRY